MKIKTSLISLIIFCIMVLSIPSYAWADNDHIRIFVNSREIITDAPGQMIDGHVYVPAASIAEPLGARVEWDEENQAVIIYESGTQPVSPTAFKAASGSDLRIFINGQEIKPDVPPKLMNGRVMVPAGVVAESLGARVSWNQEEQAVIIKSRDLQKRITSNQTAAPFNPTDIFMFDLSDWTELDIVKKTHTAVVGSAHQSIDPRQELFLQESDLLANITAVAHQNGLKYTAHFTSDIGGPETAALDAEVACRDIDGNIIYWSMPTETPRVWKSYHYPALKDYLIENTQKAVDCGVDIICIDTWTLNYDVLYSRGFDGVPRNGDFSENSMKDFRDYLRNQYAEGQLRDLGIADINTFDYGEFIRNNYLNQYKQGNKGQVPLFRDFADFQLFSSQNFWKDIINATKAYAQTRGKQVLFTTNTPDNAEHSGLIPGISLAGSVDGFMSEYVFGLPPYNKTIPTYKLYQSLGQPVALIPNGGFSGELLSRPDITELMKIYTAEAYASGEITYVPYQNIVNMNGWQLFSADMNELQPYYDFISGNKKYYDNLVSTAPTAVFYSYPSVKNYQLASDNFLGIGNLLLDIHHQYDVLFAGDNKWIEDKLTLDKLNQYNVIILPNVKDLSDQQLNLLLEYMEQGGNVLAFGETGTHDESDNPRARIQLNGLLTQGTHPYGLGQFVYLNDDIGAQYAAYKDANIRQGFAGTLNGLAAEDIQTNASDKVAMLNYWNTGIGANIIHLINYDYDTNAQHFNQQGNIGMEVLLDRSLLGKELGVYYASPDWIGVKELTFTINNNKIDFVIPGLDTYGVVYIGEKAQFGAK